MLAFDRVHPIVRAQGSFTRYGFLHLLGVTSGLFAAGCIALKPSSKNDRTKDASVAVDGSRTESEHEDSGRIDVDMPADVAADPPSGDDRAKAGDIATYDANNSPTDIVDASEDQSIDRGLEDVESEAVGPEDGNGDVTGRPDAGDVCIPNCPTLGDFRCEFVPGPGDLSIPRKLQVCSLARGCLEWLDTAVCNDNEICCSGACRERGSLSSCEVDIYVDAKNGVDELEEAGLYEGGIDDAHQTRPFRTITFAIDRAKAWPGKRIHVAAGLYDAALGERFPLVLRNGTSIVGAGSTLVTVQGSGPYDHTSAGGSYPNDTHLTVVIGDSTLPASISGLTLHCDQSTQTTNYNGILCDRGSGPAQSDNAAVGVTTLDDLVIGPGYWISVVAANSVSPTRSGCNLRMTRCAMSGGEWGVVAMGHDWSQANPVLASVQIGNETYGNSFASFKSMNDLGGGVLIWPGVTSSSIRHNAFSVGQMGVLIDQRGDDRAAVSSFKINNNTFENLSVSGVFIWNQTPLIEELNDNTFTNISIANEPSTYDTAWALAANGSKSDARFPPIKARRNRFIGNDVGVVFGDAKGIDFSTNGPIDFGRPGDPGGNVFRCNSHLSKSTGDVFISVSGTGAIPFAGNAWDHAPPTTGTDSSAADGSSPPNGTDIIFFSPGNLDTSGGSVDTSACPAGRVPGP